MAIDTPARLAILGAGPIGLEAALYARFLGYDVVIYERGEVAERVREGGSAVLLKSFQENRTTLGLAALQAQDEAYEAPGGDAILTCQAWRERYLLPLAATDLLGEHLRLHTTVTAIDVFLAGADENTTTEQFRVSALTPSGQISHEAFDGILDCTGVGEKANWSPAENGAEYFHILGSKASGSPDFPMTEGYEQIRAAFAIIGDRPSLDLYASASRLLR